MADEIKPAQTYEINAHCENCSNPFVPLPWPLGEASPSTQHSVSRRTVPALRVQGLPLLYAVGLAVPPDSATSETVAR